MLRDSEQSAALIVLYTDWSAPRGMLTFQGAGLQGHRVGPVLAMQAGDAGSRPEQRDLHC